MRDMADWAVRKTEAGPLVLGHRIGHLQEDPKLFRAVVYDKGAWVLHMLRGIVGADAFREGLMAFQTNHRFEKADTADLRAALEAAGGRDLDAYFESWIYRTALPTLSLAHHHDVVPGGFRTTVIVKAQDLPGPVPLQVTLRFLDDAETHVETLQPEGGRWEYVTSAPPRKVEINDDLGLLARRRD
jgi:aminopeptidase N